MHPPTVLGRWSAAVPPAIVFLCLALLVARSDSPEPAQKPSALSEAEKTEVLDRSSQLMLGSQPDSIRPFLKPHIETARAEGDSAFLLTLLLRSGSVLSGQGQVRDSEPFLREAMHLSEALADSLALCTTLRWLGFAAAGQGNHAEARDLCRRLLDLALLIDDPEHAGWASTGLAWQASRRGDHKEAAKLNQSAVQYFTQAQETSGLAFALNELASAHFRMGSYEEALRHRRRSVEVAHQIEFESRRDYILSNALNDLGVLEFSLGDPGTAAQRFQDAWELHRKRGNLRAQIDPGLNVAICETHLGRYADAVDRLENLTRICEEQHYPDLLGRVLAQQVIVRRMQGHYREAATLGRRVLSLGDALNLPTRIANRVQLALALAAMDSSSQALAVLEDALDLPFRAGDAESDLILRDNLGLQLHKMGRHREALVHLKHVDRGTQRLGLLYRRVPAMTTAGMCYHALGVIDSAFAAFEGAANAWETDRSVPLDPEWREQRGARGRELYTRIAALYLEHPEAVPRTERIRAAFERIQPFKARTLLERMLGPGTAAETSHQGDLPEPPSLDRLQGEVLKPGELFLDTFVGKTTGFLFAVTPKECRVIHLPSQDELDRKIAVLLSVVSSPAPQEDLFDADLLGRVCGSLGERLLGDIADLVDQSDRILISADGSLNLIPWRLLVEPATREKSASESAGAELPIAAKQIVRVPSAAFLAWQRAGPKDRDRAAGVFAVAATRSKEQQELPGARVEVQRLARSYDGVDAQLVTANSRSITDRLPGYDVLHFAAHARVDDQHPWRSMIEFYPDSPEENLRADRIAGMRLPARLAVLSSCESAGGRVLSGEGVQGLSSAFLSAGVPTVLATLWRIDDRSTVRLITRFYEELADGRTAAAALRAAQATMQEDRSTRWPYYWAGFVLVGDAETSINLRRRLDVTGYLPLLLLPLAVGFALMIRRPARR